MSLAILSFLILLSVSISQSQAGDNSWQSRKFYQCCENNRRINPSCYKGKYNLCDFGNINKDILVHAYAGRTCPPRSHYGVLRCASGVKDHTRCCKQKIKATGIYAAYQFCSDYCYPSKSIPRPDGRYLPCVFLVDKIAECFKEGMRR